jgi:anthranilate synthase component 1
LEKYYFKTESRKLLADTFTPVSMYLLLRDHFANAILLESADYHGNENAFTYICFEPVAKIEVMDNRADMTLPDGGRERIALTERHQAVALLHDFATRFSMEGGGHKFVENGLFGYMTYDAVQYFEDITFTHQASPEMKIPQILYQVYRYVIVVNHFNEEVYLFEHQVVGHEVPPRLDFIQSLLSNRSYVTYDFSVHGEEEANHSPEVFLDMVQKGKGHCQRGDVFQIVLSRRFSRAFKGDDFNVYRALRSINPSPYLFYFDFGNFRIFGSSPEAQLVIKNREAAIYPIAGTFLRTGNDQQDAALAQQLFDDPKENSEHVMLVDLARNDLSRNGEQVRVETFKEIQYFSHVIHLVSKVVGKVTRDNMLQVVADTFPAGTLSGAPKFMAMQLIDQYEQTNRGYYGGCIGFLGFNGDFNHAIMIRSLFSKNNRLYYQAGAGIVARSVPESELAEVNNKLMALRKAIDMACKL